MDTGNDDDDTDEDIDFISNGHGLVYIQLYEKSNDNPETPNYNSITEFTDETPTLCIEADVFLSNDDDHNLSIHTPNKIKKFLQEDENFIDNYHDKIEKNNNSQNPDQFFRKDYRYSHALSADPSNIAKRLVNCGEAYKDECIYYLYTHIEFLRSELQERDSLIQEMLLEATKRLPSHCYCDTRNSNNNNNQCRPRDNDLENNSLIKSSQISQILVPNDVDSTQNASGIGFPDRYISGVRSTDENYVYKEIESETLLSLNYRKNTEANYSKSRVTDDRNYSKNLIVVESITEKSRRRRFNVKLNVSAHADERDIFDYLSPLLGENPKYVILHNGGRKFLDDCVNDISGLSLRLKHDIETMFPSSQVVFTCGMKRHANGVALENLHEQIHEFEVFHDKAVENRVLSLRVKCKNNCEWTGELRALEEHIKTCPFDYIHCTNEDCKLPLQRSFLPTHLSEECSFRILACVFCTENYVSKDAQVHAATCGSLPIDCSNGCGKKDIKRNKMEMHLQTCPLSILACPYVDVGCQFKSTKSLRDVHEEAAVKDHLFLAMERIKILEEKAFGARDSLDDTTLEDAKHEIDGEYDKYVRKIN